MTPVEKLKKNVWYGVQVTPPRRTEPLGSLYLLLWLDDKPQPGRYSHEEKQFYVICHKYAPKTRRQTDIQTDVQGINDALTWEEIPAQQVQAWRLIERPDLNS